MTIIHDKHKPWKYFSESGKSTWSNKYQPKYSKTQILVTKLIVSVLLLLSIAFFIYMLMKFM